VVVRKALHTILRNPNGNRNVLYLYRNDDGQWNWNYNWLDNDWDADNLSAGYATLFISPSLFSEGVLFWKLSVPSAEHPADLAQIFGKSDIFFVVDWFSFPEDHQKYLESVCFSDGKPHKGSFSSRGKKPAIATASIISSRNLSALCPRV
jgi:hypothetical protein